MTLLFMDGFDHYATGDILNKWSGRTGSGFWYTDITTGGRNGNCVYLHTTSTVALYKLISPGSDTITVGFAFNTPTNNGGVFFEFWGSSREMCLRCISGNIYLYRDQTYVDSGTATINNGVWNFIEFEVYSDNSSGTAKVYVNGGLDIDYTGDTQTSSTPNQVRFIGAAAMTVYIDDLYVLDSTGSMNNSPLGDVKIETLFPDGAGNYTQWSPTGEASNYLCVDDAAPDDDSTYVATSGTNYKDTYTMDDLSTAQGSIYGIYSHFYAKKDGEANVQVSPMYRINSTDYALSGGYMSTSYGYFHNLRAKNPDTGTAWTITEVNGLEFGYEKTE